MARWEYAMLCAEANVSMRRKEALLDDFGAAGWELVTASVDAHGTHFCFKRRVSWFVAMWRWFDRKRRE
jgi:hypothetical protein